MLGTHIKKKETKALVPNQSQKARFIMIPRCGRTLFGLSVVVPRSTVECGVNAMVLNVFGRGRA